jgi:hypothetical protein
MCRSDRIGNDEDKKAMAHDQRYTIIMVDDLIEKVSV